MWRSVPSSRGWGVSPGVSAIGGGAWRDLLVRVAGCVCASVPRVRRGRCWLGYGCRVPRGVGGESAAWRRFRRRRQGSVLSTGLIRPAVIRVKRISCAPRAIE